MSQAAALLDDRLLPANDAADGRTVLQERVDELTRERDQLLDEWLEPYRRLWAERLNALEKHLGEEAS